MLYAITLCNSKDRSSLKELIVPVHYSDALTTNNTWTVPSGRREKFSLIKDIAINTYYDLVGQVIKIYPNTSCVELYITDYTSNNLLYNYQWGKEGEKESAREGDEYGYCSRGTTKKWRGPLGKRTLLISLWSPHASFARTHVNEDDFVHLRNVHVKYSKDAKIEGALHTDHKYHNRIDITPVQPQSDDRVKDVLRRKKEYYKQFKQESGDFVDKARVQKRKQGEHGETLSRNQMKKQRKQEREQAESANQDTVASTIKTFRNELNKNSKYVFPEALNNLSIH